MTTVLLHTVGGDGLGHLSRSLAIAQALAGHAGVRPVLLTESRDVQLAEGYGFPMYMLPARYAIPPDSAWQGIRCVGSQLWRNVYAEVLAQIGPDLLVHDTIVYDDIFHLAQLQSIPQSLVLRQRPTVASISRTILSGMRVIVLPADVRDQAIPDHLLGTTRIERCAPILRPWSGKVVRETLLVQYGLDPSAVTTIVCNAGGGAFIEDPFLDIVGGALRLVSEHIRDLQVLVVVGPLFQQALDAVCGIPGLRLYSFLPDLVPLFAAAQLVIARGGYNTIHELLQVGVPSLCLPARRSHDDQAQRIDDAAHQARNVQRGQETPDGLAVQILDVLKAPLFGHSDVDVFTTGADEAAVALLKAIS